MATKVKGSAIQDKSIAIDALNQDLQDRISLIGTSDWNAKENQPGYINNRTHYVEKVTGEHFEVADDIHEIRYTIENCYPYNQNYYLKIYYAFDNIEVINVFRNINEFVDENGFVRFDDQYIGSVEESLIGAFRISFWDVNGLPTLVVQPGSEFFNSYDAIEQIVVEKVYYLEDKFLPDTIANKSYVDEKVANIKTPNPDWNANENEPGYIANKPVGEIFKQVEWYVEENGSYLYCTEISNQIKINGIVYDISEDLLSLEEPGIGVLVDGDGIHVYGGWDLELSELVLVKVKSKLDEKYIPDTIVRKSDIPVETGNVPNSVILKNSRSIASNKYAVALGADNIFGKSIPNSGDKLEYATASGYASHAEGAAHALGDYSHAEGGGNTDLTSEGFKTVSTAEGECSHAEGTHTHAEAGSSHAEGNRTRSRGVASHAEGRETLTEGLASHAEGFNSKTGGTAEENTRTLGDDTRSGAYAHAEGNATIAKGIGSHSEGAKTIAVGNYAHSEGQNTKAVGYRSHAEGKNTQSVGLSSHSEGEYTISNGKYSHVEGYYTQTNNEAEHAEGKYNKSNSTTIHSVGIGTSSKRKNAHEITTDGKHFIYGIGGYDGTNPGSAKDLAQVLTEKETTPSIYTWSWNEEEESGALEEGVYEKILNADVVHINASGATLVVDKVIFDDSIVLAKTQCHENVTDILWFHFLPDYWFVETRTYNNSSDWSVDDTSKSSYIECKTHFVRGLKNYPIELWTKTIDSNGDYIYSKELETDYNAGCWMSKKDTVDIGHYVYFTYNWTSLFPNIHAEVRLFQDADEPKCYIEIKFNSEYTPESFADDQFQDWYFAVGYADTLIQPLNDCFIPSTVLRKSEVKTINDTKIIGSGNIEVCPNLQIDFDILQAMSLSPNTLSTSDLGDCGLYYESISRLMLGHFNKIVSVNPAFKSVWNYSAFTVGSLRTIYFNSGKRSYEISETSTNRWKISYYES